MKGPKIKTQDRTGTFATPGDMAAFSPFKDDVREKKDKQIKKEKESLRRSYYEEQ